MSQPLQGKVALVAGATRGGGRGIAVALGEAGATVYATGRSTREQRSEVDRPGDDRGDRRAGHRGGRRGHRRRGRPPRARRRSPAWSSASTPSTAGSTCSSTTSGAPSTCSSGTRRCGSTTSTHGLRLLRLAIDTHLITSHHALPLLLRRPGGLVVEVTDGTAEYNADHYRDLDVLRPRQDVGDPAGVGAGAGARATHGGTAVALTPGWMRSEVMLEHYGVSEANWRDATERSPHFCISESRRASSAAPSPRSPPTPTSRAGTAQSLSSGGLAQVYGFTDLDGTRPDCWRYMVEVQEATALPAGRRRLPLSGGGRRLVSRPSGHHSRMADDEQVEIGIEWGAASVSGGRLSVPFTGKPPAGWLERFEHVIGRLEHGGGGWGAIKVAKKQVRVDEVQPGAESDLRHLLESAVLQANADSAAAGDADAGDERAGPDQEMTDAFRAFGG